MNLGTVRLWSDLRLLENHVSKKKRTLKVRLIRSGLSQSQPFDTSLIQHAFSRTLSVSLRPRVGFHVQHLTCSLEEFFDGKGLMNKIVSSRRP